MDARDVQLASDERLLALLEGPRLSRSSASRA
jgi:hypothetical protein